jgi:hypothetical protein
MSGGDLPVLANRADLGDVMTRGIDDRHIGGEQ